MFDVELYVDNSLLQRNSTTACISNYGQYLQWVVNENEVIMDIGCGDGFGTAHILKPFISDNSKKFTLRGVDFNKEFIEYARKKYGNFGINFDVMDVNSVEDTGRYENSVDKIFSFYCLHWCPDMKIGFKNIHRMLKSGGSVFSLMVTKVNPLNFLFDEQLISNKWKDHFSGPFKKFYRSPIMQLENPDVWFRNILDECKFDVIVCKVVRNDYTFANLDQFKGFLLSAQGLCEHLSPQLKEEFFEELRIGTEEKMKSLTVSFGWLLVIATKN